MNKTRFLCTLMFCLAISVHMNAANETDLQDAVCAALNGTLIENHIGPEETQRLQALIRSNSAQAIQIVLSVLKQPGSKGRIEDVFVVNVATLTATNDKNGTAAMLKKYIVLTEAALNDERATIRKSKSTADKASHRERIYWLDKLGKRMKIFEKDLIKQR